MNLDDALAEVRKLIREKNEGKMADEIAVLELELELKRENLELRQKLAAMIDYTSMQEQLAKTTLENETYNLKEMHKAFRDRVIEVVARGESGGWIYTLSRRPRNTGPENNEFFFEYDSAAMIWWLYNGNPDGSLYYRDIPDELESFRNSFPSVREANKRDFENASEGEDEKVELEQEEPVCMDEAGVPTKFIRKCRLCGEEGRNSQTHKDEPIEVNGRLTYHWI